MIGEWRRLRGRRGDRCWPEGRLRSLDGPMAELQRGAVEGAGTLRAKEKG